MNVSSKELFLVVRQEANNLLKYATSDELSKLNFKRLDASRRDECIYGQMTGHCDSRRSMELMELSAERVFYAANTPAESNELNGSPKDLPRYHYWSPIEVFISKRENMNNGNNAQLVSFLRGKRKTLRFAK